MLNNRHKNVLAYVFSSWGARQQKISSSPGSQSNSSQDSPTTSSYSQLSLMTEYQENSSNSLIKPPLPVFKDTSNNSASGGSKKNVLANVFKGFVFYGVTFDLCRFCTFLNSAQLAGWAKFKNVQNLHKSNVTP